MLFVYTALQHNAIYLKHNESVFIDSVIQPHFICFSVLSNTVS